MNIDIEFCDDSTRFQRVAETRRRRIGIRRRYILLTIGTAIFVGLVYAASVLYHISNPKPTKPEKHSKAFLEVNKTAIVKEEKMLTEICLYLPHSTMDSESTDSKNSTESKQKLQKICKVLDYTMINVTREFPYMHSVAALGKFLHDNGEV